MVSYFYKADYNVSQYDTSEALLHAQVAIIADEYDCASLYKLARTSFMDSVNAIEGENWVAVAALIYDHTTELRAHEELRSLVVSAVASRPVVLNSILQLKSAAGLFRSSADLATDLLLSEPHTRKIANGATYIFICNKCQYAHVGARECSYLTSVEGSSYGMMCPKCGTHTGITTKKFTYRVSLVRTYSCPSCDGIHTSVPMHELQLTSVDASN